MHVELTDRRGIDRTAHGFKGERPVVDILLSTYNGEAYLREQLESILTQTYPNWRILFRDDGSSDGTTAILSEYRQRYAERFICVDSSCEHLGVVQSYSRLLMKSTAPLVMFSDQDDVWKKDKITNMVDVALQLMREDPAMPFLIHSDLTVVDRNLRIIAPSFWRYERIRPTRNGFSNILLKNTVTGCAAMINSCLRDICGTIPKEAIMHDWWVALLAAAVGIIVPLPYPTVFYRQHGRNEIGASRRGLNYYIARVSRLPESRVINRALARQASVFIQQYYGVIPPHSLATARAFSTVYERNRLFRVPCLVRNRLAKANAIQTLAFYVSSLL